MDDFKAAKVLIVEDEPLIARNIKNIVTKLGHEVVGLAYSGDSALDLLANRNPTLVLLDINLEGTVSGIRIAEIINKNYSIPFIFITSFSDNITLNKAAKTFPDGYIVKPFDENDLATTIAITLSRFANNNKELNREGLNAKFNVNLSNKEYEILNDLLKGLTNPQLAEKHFVSLNTVKSHVKNIYNKLGTHNRTETASKILE